MDIYNKEFPHNLEAEISVLGAILLDNSLLTKIIEIITPNDFYKTSHSIIFETMIELYNNRKPIDILILNEELSKKNMLDKVGGPAYLSFLTDNISLLDNIERYALIIKEKSVLRKLINNLLSIADKGFKNVSIENLLDESVTKILSILNEINNNYRDVVPIKNVVKDVVDYYYRVKSGDRGIITPWKSMNDMVVGFQPDDFVIFVARSNVGKTWILIILSHFVLENNKKVLFISPEMSRKAVAMRFLSYKFKIPYKDFRAGKLGEFVEKEVMEAIQNYNKDGLYLMCEGDNFTLPVIENKINIYKPDVVFIDGIYLLSAEGKDNYEKMCNIAHGLKRISKYYKLPVITTMQFNRNIKQTAKSAETRDIALTDMLAWDASYIFGLLQDSDMSRDKKMLIVPIKVREGEKKEFMIHWDLDLWNFAEIQTEDSQYEDNDYDEVPF